MSANRGDGNGRDGNGRDGNGRDGRGAGGRNVGAAGVTDDGMASWVAALSDDELLARLAIALEAVGEVPARFVTVGKATWTWRTIDSELAELTYDSAQDWSMSALVSIAGDAGAANTTRAEQAVLRALTFAAAELTIELEVTQDALLGQVVPAQPAMLALQRTGVASCCGPNGEPVQAQTEVRVDEVGWFRLAPVPTERFRLRCTTESGCSVVTTWIVL